MYGSCRIRPKRQRLLGNRIKTAPYFPRFMAVSLNRGTPMWTPRYCNHKKRDPNFGKAAYAIRTLGSPGQKPPSTRRRTRRRTNSGSCLYRHHHVPQSLPSMTAAKRELRNHNYFFCRYCHASSPDSLLSLCFSSTATAVPTPPFTTTMITWIWAPKAAVCMLLHYLHLFLLLISLLTIVKLPKANEPTKREDRLNLPWDPYSSPYKAHYSSFHFLFHSFIPS